MLINPGMVSCMPLQTPTSLSTQTVAPVTTAISVPPPSVLRGKTIEEIVNKWTADLDSHVREFNKSAGEVAVWDRALMENGNNVSAKTSIVDDRDRAPEIPVRSWLRYTVMSWLSSGSRPISSNRSIISNSNKRTSCLRWMLTNGLSGKSSAVKEAVFARSTRALRTRSVIKSKMISLF